MSREEKLLKLIEERLNKDEVIFVMWKVLLKLL